MMHGHCYIVVNTEVPSTNTVDALFTYHFRYHGIVPLKNYVKIPTCPIGKCHMRFFTDNNRYELNESDRNITGSSHDIEVFLTNSTNRLYDYAWSLKLNYTLFNVSICQTEEANVNSTNFDALKECGTISIEKRSDSYIFISNLYIFDAMISIGLQKSAHCNGKR